MLDNHSEKSFEQLADNIPICLAFVDAQENIYYMNKHLNKVMGYTIEDVPTMNRWWPLGYPDPEYRAEVIDRWSKAVAKAVATGKPIIPDEYNVTCKDGSVLVMEIYGAPVGDSHLVIFDDKTERKKNELQLIEGKEKYEKVIDSSPIGITVYDSTGQCITGNQAMADIIGTSLEQVLAQNFHNITSWKNAGLYDKATMAIESGNPQQIDVKLISTFKKEIYLGCYFVPFSHGGLLFMAHDLSRLRAAEEELVQHKDHLENLVKQRSKELANSELQYRELINNTDTGFVVLDDKGIVIEANIPYLHLTGRDHLEDIIGLSVVEWTAPECIEDFSAVMQQCAREGRIRNFETIYLKADSSRCVIQIDATTHNAPKGLRITTFCRNITEQKTIEEQRMRASKLESLGFLAGGIAHDFNNKLGTIMNNIQLAKTHLEPDSKAYLNLNSVEKTFWQTTHLTNQLLAFSKGISIQYSVFSLAQLLKDTVQFTLSGSGIEPVFEVDPALLSLEADRGQISQVISNIVQNAREAMGDNGTITIKATNLMDATESIAKDIDAPIVRIEFIDRGHGIPKQEINKIFDPFYSSKQNGHGIGLALSHKIITSHKGIIEVISEENFGSSFVLYLPASNKQILNEKTQAKVAEKSDSHNILLMDDDDDFRQSFAELIMVLGHEVYQANKGETAIDIYQDFLDQGNRIDLVILDMTIKGGLGGIETFKKLRSIDPDVKAIVASGYTDRLTGADYTKMGFIDYLMKPINRDDLEKVLSNL